MDHVLPVSIGWQSQVFILCPMFKSFWACLGMILDLTKITFDMSKITFLLKFSYLTMMGK